MRRSAAAWEYQVGGVSNKNPPEPFGEVIRTHFRLKARSIIQQLDAWLAEDDARQTVVDGASVMTKSHAPVPVSLPSGSGSFSRDVEELKQLLIGLQSEEAGIGHSSNSA